MHDELGRNDIADLGGYALQRPKGQRDAHGKQGARRGGLREIINEALEGERLIDVQACGNKAERRRQDEGVKGHFPSNIDRQPPGGGTTALRLFLKAGVTS